MENLVISAATLEFLMYAGILAGICFAVGTGLNFIVYYFLRLYNKRRKSELIGWFLHHTKNAVHLFTPLLLLLISEPLLKEYEYYRLLHNVTYVLFYSSFAWLVIKIVYTFSDTIITRQDIGVKDNLTQRRLYTQMQFLKRLVTIVVIIFFLSIILMNFESIRKLGAGILTSAGIAGIIIGFAAQKSLSNLMAGLQIAFSQPIKIDDAVIVENEFGNVEEITLTYVVIKIWDMRRLVVPLNYFIEKPFQNWTRTSSDILGTVIIHADYNTPLEPLRKEFDRLLDNSPLWDGKTKVLQVVNANEKTIEIRALMSSANGGDSWNLRCEVREKLITYLQKNYPGSLPVMRVAIGNMASK